MNKTLMLALGVDPDAQPQPQRRNQPTIEFEQRQQPTQRRVANPNAQPILDEPIQLSAREEAALARRLAKSRLGQRISAERLLESVHKLSTRDDLAV
jgi:hypothetical protein